MNEAIGEILPLGLDRGPEPDPDHRRRPDARHTAGRANGLAFLLGWAADLTLVGVIVLLVSGAIDASDDSEPATWVSVLELALGPVLVGLAVKQWRGRPRGDQEASPPKWMTTIDSFKPPKALGFGVVLSSVNPENLVITVAAAAAIATTGIGAGQETIALVVFILIGTERRGHGRDRPGDRRQDPRRRHRRPAAPAR